VSREVVVMTQEQIREIVRLTVDEILNRKLIKDVYLDVLDVVERKLKEFFNNRGDGNNIHYALNQLSDDPYIDIIFLQYRDGKTIEFIAEIMDRDVSTIKRNKKRLILKIYELLEVGGGKN
jgi:DNA-directed RNA polymerase specialized sigma24 family protein